MKKFQPSWHAAGQTAASVALSVVLLANASALAATFTDVPASNWANPFIDYLSGRNVITGYPDNTFKPVKPVTRAEFAVMLAKSQGMPSGSGGSQVFNDVPATHWAAQAIQAVANQGWIAGYPGGRFMPDQNISMAEMYTILSKPSGQNQVSAAEADTVLRNFSDAAMIPAWARIPVATAVKNGINVKEMAPNSLMPNVQATRASVATAIARLVNPSFRDTSIAQQPTQPQTQSQQGAAINVTGTLQATANPGEWVVVTSDNNRYYFTNPAAAISSQPWFRVGNQVQLSGNMDVQNSTTLRPVVTISALNAVQSPQNQVSVTGTLQPSAQTQGAWQLRTADNQLYRIMNPEAFSNTNQLRYGANVTVTGTLRPDVGLPQGEGAALVASRIETSQASNQISITGTLAPTVEAGGWTVTGPDNKKYVLLGAQNVQNESWFKSGNQIIVQGTLKPDVASIYQEGPILAVTSIEPSPTGIQGTQQVGLYFPSFLNVARDPVTMLGNPIYRNIQGPNIPQQAIQALLNGPTSTEKMQGFFADNEIKQLTLGQFTLTPDGRANVVLDAPADFQFKNPLTTQRLGQEMQRTLTQFSGIKEVGVSVRGPNNTVIWSSQ